MIKVRDVYVHSDKKERDKRITKIMFQIIKRQKSFDLCVVDK